MTIKPHLDVDNQHLILTVACNIDPVSTFVVAKVRSLVSCCVNLTGNRRGDSNRYPQYMISWRIL